MTSKNDQSQPESQVRWETARSRSSSEVLAILAPTAEEPKAILRSGFWKTGIPAPGSTA